MMKLVTRQYMPIPGTEHPDIQADERQVKREIRARFRRIDSIVSVDDTEISITYFLYACPKVPEIDRKLDEIMDELFYVPFTLCALRTCLRT